MVPAMLMLSCGTQKLANTYTHLRDLRMLLTSEDLQMGLIVWCLVQMGGQSLVAVGMEQSFYGSLFLPFPWMLMRL